MHALTFDEIALGDLADLVAKAALTRTGQLKGTRYHLNLLGTSA
jgi:hypothetical protein